MSHCAGHRLKRLWRLTPRTTKRASIEFDAAAIGSGRYNYRSDSESVLRSPRLALARRLACYPSRLSARSLIRPGETRNVRGVLRSRRSLEVWGTRAGSGVSPSLLFVLPSAFFRSRSRSAALVSPVGSNERGASGAIRRGASTFPFASKTKTESSSCHRSISRAAAAASWNLPISPLGRATKKGSTMLCSAPVKRARADALKSNAFGISAQSSRRLDLMSSAPSTFAPFSSSARIASSASSALEAYDTAQRRVSNSPPLSAGM